MNSIKSLRTLVFVTVVKIFHVAVYAAYCGHICNPSEVPNGSLTAQLELVNLSFRVEGTIEIVNDCEFTVKGFKISPEPEEAKWYATSSSIEGILLSNDIISANDYPMNINYNIENTDPFCHASLLKDIGEGGKFFLLDKNYNTIALAIVTASTSSSPNTVNCNFQYDETTKTCTGTIECNGFNLLDSNRIVEYDEAKSTCKVVLNPPPGYYKNASDDFIKCTSTECSKVQPLSIACGNNSNGQLIYDNVEPNRTVKLCTKINSLKVNDDSSLELEDEKFATIEFGESTDSYIVHYNKESPFNFDTHAYYVVKKTEYSICYDSQYPKVNDHCAANDGKMIDRRTDFCSNDSSGMYYQCIVGKCSAESQVNGEEELIADNSFCNCNSNTDYSSSSNTCYSGYQGKIDGDDMRGIYQLDTNKKCKVMNNVSIGYYRDGYHYSKFTYWDGIKYVQYAANVQVNPDCTGKAGEFIDNGYNVLFCKDDSTPIPFNSITESTVLYIKGKEGSDSPFGKKDKYYALIKNDSESLIVNEEKTGYYLNDDKKLLLCDKGICDDKSNGVNGYYINGQATDKYLIHCTNGECEIENKEAVNGYYFNVDTITNVILCGNIACTKFEVLTKTDCTGNNYMLIYIPNSGLNYCNGNTAVPITSNINLYYEIPLSTADVGIIGSAGTGGIIGTIAKAIADLLGGNDVDGINYPISVKGNTGESIIIHLDQYSVAQYVSDQDICFDDNHQKEHPCTLNNKKYTCTENTKSCTVVVTAYCNPESENANEKASCSGYYLSSTKDLLFCSKKSGAVTCEKQSLTGYFLNSDINSESNNRFYILCKKSVSRISCTGFAKPTESQCRSQGDVIISDGGYKLCLDSLTVNAMDIFKSGMADEYFMPATLITEVKDIKHYYIAKVDENSVQAKPITQHDRQYRYTFNNYKILPNAKGQCNKGTGTAETDLIEYSKDPTDDNIYKREK